jgi:hypothetical protein
MRVIEPLPLFDHKTVQYEPFEKNFYDEDPELFAMSDLEVIELRASLGTPPPSFRLFVLALSPQN